MYNKVECVSLSCDNCQVTYENSDSGFSIFVDKDSASEEAENDEWFMQDGKYYCPDCFKINDEDELIIDTTRTVTPPTEPNTVDNVLSDEAIKKLAENCSNEHYQRNLDGSTDKERIEFGFIVGYKAALQPSPIK